MGSILCMHRVDVLPIAANRHRNQLCGIVYIARAGSVDGLLSCGVAVHLFEAMERNYNGVYQEEIHIVQIQVE